LRLAFAAVSPWQAQRCKDFANYAEPFAIGELISCDMLGEVVESRAKGWAAGDFAMGRLGWQEFADASPAALTRCDPAMSASTWLTALSSPGLSAWFGFADHARPMPGETCVITSAAGALGSFAVQIAVAAGMRVVGIAGEAEKCRFVTEELGATACLDYREPDLEGRLRRAAPDGVHLFYDTVGGPAGDAVFANMAKYGRIVLVGRSAANNSDDPGADFANMRMVWARECTVETFSMYSLSPERRAEGSRRMAALVESGAVRPRYTLVDGFEQTPQALHDVLAGKLLGKALVRYWQPEGIGA
jgi:NADPH-dependent curcumin reductase CurA